MSKSLELEIEGMDCASCVQKIENAVCALPGAQNVTVNYVNQRLKLDLDENATKAALVSSTVERLGYKVTRPDNKPETVNLHWWQTPKGRLVLASGAILALA